MNMKSRMNVAARALLLVCGLACAAGAQANMRKLAFERGAAASIRSIDVLDVVQQQPLVVMPRQTHWGGPPPATQGVTGVYANPAPSLQALQSASAKLGDGFARRGNSLPVEFGKQLVDALRAAGFDARALHNQQPRGNSIGARQKIDGVNSQSDAVLYTVLRFAGYKDDAAAGGIVPATGVDVYLFARDGKLLYRQVFNQGFRLLNDPDVESLPVPAMAKFSSPASLNSASENAARGLVEALQPVANRIAQQLAQ